jgi:malate dehydrogenase
MRNKITVVGAGFVGSTAAQRIAEKELGDVVLVDINEGAAQGKALDMMESAPVEGFDSKIIGTSDYKHIEGSQVIVVTAGLPRKPGMTREDLVNTNAKIMTEVATNIKKYAPDAFVIIVTNPLDIMTYVAFKTTGFAENKVFGMAGVLDTARYRTFLGMELGVSVEDIQAMVLGGHGDQMVPLVDYTTVSGIPVRTLLSEEKIQAIVERTRKGGGEIVGLLKTGSAYYAPSAAAVQMVEAIIKDKKRVLPAAALLRGQYGIDGAHVGVPVIIGANGVEKIIELDLNKDDLNQLQSSANVIKENIEKLGLN